LHDIGPYMQELIIKEADILPNAVSVGEITYPPGGTLGPRLQPNLQLVIVHSGQMTFHVGTFDLRDIVLVAGKDPYAHKGLETIHIPHIRLSGEGGCKLPEEAEM
jgi:hypothetical protein